MTDCPVHRLKYKQGAYQALIDLLDIKTEGVN